MYLENRQVQGQLEGRVMAEPSQSGGPVGFESSMASKLPASSIAPGPSGQEPGVLLAASQRLAGRGWKEPSYSIF